MTCHNNDPDPSDFEEWRRRTQQNQPLYEYQKIRAEYYSTQGFLPGEKPEMTEMAGVINGVSISDLPKAQPIGLLSSTHRSSRLYVIKGYAGLWHERQGSFYLKRLDELAELAQKKEAMLAVVCGCTKVCYFIRAKSAEAMLEEAAQMSILDRDQDEINADVGRTLSKIREQQIELEESLQKAEEELKKGRPVMTAMQRPRVWEDAPDPISKYFEAMAEGQRVDMSEEALSQMETKIMEED